MNDVSKELQAVLDAPSTERFRYRAPDGLSEELVRAISTEKGEPSWMLELRLRALKIYFEKPMPKWGPDLSGLDLDGLTYYVTPDAKSNAASWDEVPDDIKKVYDALGIPQAEQKALAGAGAQFDSGVVYHQIKKEWEEKGVIFLDMDVALREHEALVKQYFSTVVSPALHKFSALHYAVWSGGTFIYVPKGVDVPLPLQAYFRMNARKMGQFEHTLIIVDDGARLMYIEGCFTERALITTNPDYKRISDVREGERVLTSDGTYESAKDLQRQVYSGDLYEVELYGDSTQTIEVTPDHRFLYADRLRRNERNTSFAPRWNIPYYFKKNDYLAVPIITRTDERESYEFVVPIRGGRHRSTHDIITVPASGELFRLLGYYLAEGSIMNDSYVSFSFNESERELIEDVKRCLRVVFGAEAIETHHEKNHGTNVVVCSARIARVFSALGTSSDTKAMLPFMVYAPHALQRELIAAWYRGDGNYYSRELNGIRKELFRINTTSHKLIRQGRDVLLRLGVVAFINARDRSAENRKMMYTLGITGGQMVPFSRIVGIPIDETMNGKRRASMFGIDEKFAYLPIKRITKRTVEDIVVYNFGVENTETYTVGGVAVHNCSAPQYNESSIHAGCVEVYVGRGARARYSSVENWSRNTYNLNTKSAHVHEDGVIEWVGGNLGCLTGDALVETIEGPRRIDEIEVGDHVYALDETDRSIKPRRVLGSVFSGIKEVYDVTVSGRRLRATANHPFLVMQRVKRHPSHKKGFFNATWKPLAYLRAGDLIAVPRRLPDEGAPYRLPQPVRSSFARSNNQYGDFIMRTGSSIRQIRVPDHTSEDFMWFLGLMLGDGHVSFSKNATRSKISIAIPRSSDLRKPLMETLESLFGIREFYEQERYIVVNSIQLGLLLEEIGFVGNADTKSVPRWVHTIPRSQKLAFLAGYFDSDGHVGRNGVYLTSINEDVLRSIQHVALSCGMGFSHVFKQGIERETMIRGFQCMAHDSFRLLLNGPLVGELPTRSHSYRESITRIKTKRNFTTANGVNFRHQTSDDLGFTRVQSVEAAGIEPTYDIEVEGSHNFIANGIIVHNSGVTMLYPSSILKGARAKSDHISIAFAAKDQNQDVGAKVFMLAPDTAATITSKSISLDGGITSYRGVVKVSPKATGANLSVECDALMMDNRSESNTYPVMDIQNDTATITHEATVGKISEEEVFYLMSRGIPEEQAVQMIVSGFIEPVIKELPLEYAVELNRLIALEMEGSLG